MDRKRGGKRIGMRGGALVATLAGATLLAWNAGSALAETGGGDPKKAAAAIESRSGSTVTGTATFEDMRDHVHVTVTIAGATPGEHGVHIHEKGDCSAPDAASAGPHFNPGKVVHGGPGKGPHHAGDFGNITAGPDGKGTLTVMTHDISLKKGPRSVMGRSIVIHEKPDDLKSQPAGNAGPRIGCGVIK